MQIIESINEMQAHSVSLRHQGKLISFVPTMGFLHEGHLSLFEVAKEESDVTVASIFVNPAQFGPNEDFDQYPRSVEKDLELCRQRGVDIVFLPKKEELYPTGYSTYVCEESLSQPLCGVSRPSFFKGVCTVVAKLFNIVRPDVAVFGQKDAQQAAVIRKMVQDLHFPVEIRVAPIVREADGLAMSSRNSYLNEFQRRDAVRIYQALCKGKELYDNGNRNVDRILAEIIHHISECRRLRVIYVSAVDKDTMKPITRTMVEGQTLIACAVWCDEVRLIDNLIL
ncbi:MAG: pantoate--beta-alanine ligase [Opitutales bacterium]|nr:pantoate--beta-alanine ligase [Opitutales bacterium]